MDKRIAKLTTLVVCFLVLGACGAKKEEISFEDDTQEVFIEMVDEQKHEEMIFTKELKLNEEFSVEYKTFEPEGVGKAKFSAKSVKEVSDIDGVKATEGKKLVLVEIAVVGDAKNKGRPSTFNQIGDYPSPQFVMVDKTAKTSLVEDTYYSDTYTESKKLFELSKITMDHGTWVNTALVFELNNDKEVDLAFMFTNLEGKTEFYDITDN